MICQPLPILALGSLAALTACAAAPAPAVVAVVADATAASPRGEIIPLVDHHQHIFGPELIDPPTALLPVVTLPAAFDRLLRERERIAGTRDIERLFSPDATALNVFFDTDSWVTGSDPVANVVEEHGKGLRFVPNAFHADGSAAWMSGIVHADETDEYDKHFTIGLKRRDGIWQIASEAITAKVANPFRTPLDAKTLVMRLDDAGIGRATVLSTAFWLANPRRKPVANQQTRVAAANDWVIAQTAPYADRLIPFCSVNPTSDYAIAEMRRCAANPRVRGMKLHFANGRIDLKKAEQLDQVRAFFRAANAERLAIVVHLWPLGDDGPEYSRIFIERVLAEAPDIPVQIAHLGSGAPNVFHQTLDVFATAIAAGDPRTRNLFLDVTEIITEDVDEADVQAVTRAVRKIGVDRILFGSDTPLPRYRPPPVQAWATFRRRMPLTDAELRIIANNVAPYLRAGGGR